LAYFIVHPPFLVNLLDIDLQFFSYVLSAFSDTIKRNCKTKGFTSLRSVLASIPAAFAVIPKFYQQFTNRFSITENVAFLHFLRQNLSFFAQKIQNPQASLCQKVQGEGRLGSDA
ncbi:MAG: hypothetical protein IKO89_10495, partial [Bacteroidales bacterium]|nr:hypothetical protein [Bacteroidales bacterium]